MPHMILEACHLHHYTTTDVSLVVFEAKLAVLTGVKTLATHIARQPFSQPTMLFRRYPINSINILKAHGKSAHESQLLKGYAINVPRSAQ
eukprot:9283186-Pyramimonas_sp.AAC.1